MKKRMQCQKGFSLIEVMVVVVIMGILATLGTPQLFQMIERSKRKVDATNAIELANILRRAYESDIVKFTNEDTKNNLKPDDMTLSVVVASNGINYYSGSGQVLINGNTWKEDREAGRKDFARVAQLFQEAGFTDIKVRATNNEGGWSCYGAILFSDGSTKIISATTDSKCINSGSHESFVTSFLSSANNPISAYLPSGAQ